MINSKKVQVKEDDFLQLGTTSQSTVDQISSSSTTEGDTAYNGKGKEHISTFNVMFKTVIASIGFFFFGYQQGILNLSLNTLNVVFNIQEDEQFFYEGLLSCLSPVGAIFGCIISSYMVKGFSRIHSFFVIDLISLVGALISVITYNIYFFMAGRLISGLAVGINTTLVPQYVNEISPSSLKGITGPLLSILSTLGLVVSNLQCLGYDDEPQNADKAEDLGNFWRFAFLFPGGLTLLRSLIFLIFIRQDTAQYYILKGKKDEAEAVLALNYKRQFVQKKLQAINQDIQSQKRGLKRWRDLLSPQYRKRVQVGVFLQFLHQFSGIGVIIFYSSKIFEESFDNTKLVFALALLTNVTQFLCAFISAFFSNKFGRRNLLLSGDIICFLFLCVFGVTSLLKNYGVVSSDITNPIIVACVFGYLISYGTSLGPMIWAYNSEILPEKGLSVATLTNWLCSIIIIFLFPIAINYAPIGYAFFFFSFWCLVGMIFIKFNVIETKNLSPQQIEDEYYDNNRNDIKMTKLNMKEQYSPEQNIPTHIKNPS